MHAHGLQQGLDKVALHDYGIEINSIAIIPLIMPVNYHKSYPERKALRRTTKEADIRLYVNYELFIQGRLDINEELYKEKRRYLLIKNIIDSIQIIEKRKKGDFQGLKLIDDILKEFNVTKEELEKL